MTFSRTRAGVLRCQFDGQQAVVIAVLAAGSAQDLLAWHLCWRHTPQACQAMRQWMRLKHLWDYIEGEIESYNFSIT